MHIYVQKNEKLKIEFKETSWGEDKYYGKTNQSFEKWNGYGKEFIQK